MSRKNSADRRVRLNAGLAGGSFKVPNSNEVVVINVPNVRCSERDQSLRSSRGRNKLDLESIRCMDLNDG